MLNHRESLNAQHTASWTWHVMPVLVGVAVLNVLFMPQDTSPAHAAAAEPIAIEAVHHAALLAPSPQPGEGEPALVVAHLPQSY